MTEGISSTFSVNYASMLNGAVNLSQSSSSENSSSSTKTSNEILQELKLNCLSSTMSAQKIADKYGISLSKAKEILDELKDNTEEEQLPENTTVSYQV